MRSILPLAVVAALVGACKKSEPKPDQPVTADAAAARPTTDATAAVPPTGDAGAVAADGPVRAFLYKIEKDGKTSHLLGTLHIGVDPKRLPPPVWTALEGSKTFAMETNVMDPSLLSSMMRNDGKTLEDELGADYWKKLETALGAQMAAGIKNMKASTAAALLELRSLPMTDPMDLILLKTAKDKGLAVEYLEPAKKQQALLDKWLDVRALKMMLDELEEGEKRSKEMLAAYIAGDEATMEKLAFDRSAWQESGRDDKEFDQMMKELLFDRNASWIPTIEKIHGDAFIAVGAAHLIGKGSVNELLQQKGFTVTRVAP